jgi:putative phosphoesterase
MHSLIGLVSDAHGNNIGFHRAIDLLFSQGAERIYFLGDAIGYLPSAVVLDSLSRMGDRVRCIRGNHEAMLLDGLNDPERDRIYQLEILRPKLTLSQIEMITSWPMLRYEVINDQKLLMVHGSPADPTHGYVYPDTDLTGFVTDADWVFMGNTHHPFIREQEGTVYVNIGSCGMPRDDGRYGSAGLFDSKTKRVKILRFDITKGLNEFLEKYPEIHPSVRKVFDRRHPNIIGDIL